MPFLSRPLRSGVIVYMASGSPFIPHSRKNYVEDPPRVRLGPHSLGAALEQNWVGKAVCSGAHLEESNPETAAF